MEKPKVYVESSTISYLTARPTEEPIRKAKQILTRQWWERRESFDLFISQTVLDEIAGGDKAASNLRLRLASELALLELEDRIGTLAGLLLKSGSLPVHCEADATHIAYSAVHGMNFLITWNQRHIASEKKRKLVEAVIDGFGLMPPRLLTPEQHLFYEET
ncbi:MAG: type II toxin-antitoxin system VapC family toxin [Planctomycetaceae bacterium]|nr:type II toxin-antitoxin system VapC family toxin [Planctomycetaceae bacterium]